MNTSGNPSRCPCMHDMRNWPDMVNLHMVKVFQCYC